MAEQDLQDGLQLRDVAGKAPACKDFVSSQGFQQQHGANDPDQEDSASTDQQQQQQQEEAAQPLTETVAQGLQSMEERRQQLHAMVSCGHVLTACTWLLKQMMLHHHSLTCQAWEVAPTIISRAVTQHHAVPLPNLVGSQPCNSDSNSIGSLLPWALQCRLTSWLRWDCTFLNTSVSSSCAPLRGEAHSCSLCDIRHSISSSHAKHLDTGMACAQRR